MTKHEYPIRGSLNEISSRCNSQTAGVRLSEQTGSDEARRGRAGSRNAWLSCDGSEGTGLAAAVQPSALRRAGECRGGGCVKVM